VDSRIESDYDSLRKAQSAVLSLPIEAAAVDSFVVRRRTSLFECRKKRRGASEGEGLSEKLKQRVTS